MCSNHHSVDFYVGTSPNATWIGSMISSEGEPSCLLDSTRFGRQVLEAADVTTYREAVLALFKEIQRGSLGVTFPGDGHGWPWPEPDSHRTDWVIQFHHGRAWITVGYLITPAPNIESAQPDATADDPVTGALECPLPAAPEAAAHHDQRGMLFARLRDAVDAVTEGDYPGSGLEEDIDDLRDAFNAYSALADDIQTGNSTHR